MRLIVRNRKTMKKFLSVFLVASMASGLFCSAFAGDRKVSQGRIENLVSSLREEASRAGSSEDDESVSLPGLKVSSKGGVDFVSIGKIWTRSLGLAALTGGDDDEDVRAVAGMMKSLRKLLVVSYEDCEVSLKEKFDRKISSALDGCELLAQMKDDDAGEIFRRNEVVRKTGYVDLYESLIRENKLLFTVDLIKEKLSEAYTLTDEVKMADSICEIMALCHETGNSHFLWFERLLDNHFEGIIAHATYKISTGRLEGINNKIKTLRRQAYGYPDDDYFFLKLFDASRKTYVRNQKSHKIYD